MKTKSRADRYSEAEALEIRDKNFRAPIWKQAMTVAKGDLKEAEALYTAMRVQQMEQDDDLHQQAQEAKTVRQNSQDEIGPSRFMSKALLLALLLMMFFIL